MELHHVRGGRADRVGGAMSDNEPPTVERGFCFECGNYRHQAKIGTPCPCGEANITKVKYIPASDLISLIDAWREMSDNMAGQNTSDVWEICAEELEQVLQE
jgi:hypothetical protein